MSKLEINLAGGSHITCWKEIFEVLLEINTMQMFVI